MSTALRVERPWGYELVWELSPEYVGKVLHIRRGHRLWLEARDRPCEPLLLCSGTLVLVFEDEGGSLREVPLGPGEVHDIPVKRRHRMIAVEDSDVFAIARLGFDDAVRVEDP